jgi:hypothetical protein
VLERGRGGGTRTHDLRIWNPLLYQLSYTPKFLGFRCLFRLPVDRVFLAACAVFFELESVFSFSNASCGAVITCPALGAGERDGNPTGATHSKILVTTPAPTVLPPSRMAKRICSSRATGVWRATVIWMLSPGITILTPSGSSTEPVTSVVRM